MPQHSVTFITVSQFATCSHFDSGRGLVCLQYLPITSICNPLRQCSPACRGDVRHSHSASLPCTDPTLLLVVRLYTGIITCQNIHKTYGKSVPNYWLQPVPTCNIQMTLIPYANTEQYKPKLTSNTLKYCICHLRCCLQQRQVRLSCAN